MRWIPCKTTACVWAFALTLGVIALLGQWSRLPSPSELRPEALAVTDTAHNLRRQRFPVCQDMDLWLEDVRVGLRGEGPLKEDGEDVLKAKQTVYELIVDMCNRDAPTGVCCS